MITICVNSIKYSIENRCYFVALSLELTLQDICGIAEFTNKTVVERYTK